MCPRTCCTCSDTAPAQLDVATSAPYIARWLTRGLDPARQALAHNLARYAAYARLNTFAAFSRRTRLRRGRPSPRSSRPLPIWAGERPSPCTSPTGSAGILTEYPDQALTHIVLGLGYFDDVDADDSLPVSRQQIVDYWTRRQPQIVVARSR